MFEKNIEKDTSIQDKIGNISLKDNYNDKCNDNQVYKSNDVIKPVRINGQDLETKNKEFEIVTPMDDNLQLESKNIYETKPEKTYRSSKDKFDFLQTQLSDDTLDADITINSQKDCDSAHIKDDCVTNDLLTSDQKSISDNLIDESNITDDIRLAQNSCIPTNIDTPEPPEVQTSEQEIIISVPPRRKKHLTDKKVDSYQEKAVKDSLRKEAISPIKSDKEYPDHLNPFSDDEDEVCNIGFRMGVILILL